MHTANATATEAMHTATATAYGNVWGLGAAWDGLLGIDVSGKEEFSKVLVLGAPTRETCDATRANARDTRDMG